jgi:hypothetical protein
MQLMLIKLRKKDLWQSTKKINKLFSNFPVPSSASAKKPNQKPSLSGYASFGGRRRGTRRR